MKAVIAILFGILLVAVSYVSFHFGRETVKPRLQTVHIQTRLQGTMKILGKPGPVDVEADMTITPEFIRE